jgi:hypothetical protein
MNRRSFFRGAFLAAAGVILSPVIPKRKPRGPVPPYKLLPGNRAVINPEWKDAPYEFAVLNTYGTQIIDPWPLRFRCEEDARYWLEQRLKIVRASNELHNCS